MIDGPLLEVGHEDARSRGTEARREPAAEPAGRARHDRRATLEGVELARRELANGVGVERRAHPPAHERALTRRPYRY